VKVDKTLIASIALHVIVLGYGLVSFSSKAFEAVEIEAVPVDFVTDDQLSKITAGIKSGKKENPKPPAEKIAEAKPVDDAVGKISEKKPIVTDAAPDPTPKPEKPVEKKPDPPKPIAEAKPKEEAPKPIEKKPDPPKVDPIAEALKKEEVKKPAPQPQAKAAPPPPPVKKREYKFDTETISALVDKRDPTRQAFAGATLNSAPALGTAKGTAPTLSASYLSALVSKIHDCWQRDGGGFDEESLKIPITLTFKVDGTLANEPLIEISPRTPRERAIIDGARRAIIACQPYNMLPPAKYAEWRSLPFLFDNKAF
jgi:outer membrane biosynthesis protein TonB